MAPVEHFAAMTDVEVAHLALDAAGVVAPAAADAAAAGNFGQQRIAPALEMLRGEQPRLAASFV